LGSQTRNTPSIADLDSDGDLEIVTTSGVGIIFAYHHDGTMVAGFPIQISGPTLTFPVIGDVDGDGALEIVYSHGGVQCFLRMAPSRIWLHWTLYGSTGACMADRRRPFPDYLQTYEALNVWRVMAPRFRAGSN
jgi:hypothetical protein